MTTQTDQNVAVPQAAPAPAAPSAQERMTPEIMYRRVNEMQIIFVESMENMQTYIEEVERAQDVRLKKIEDLSGRVDHLTEENATLSERLATAQRLIDRLRMERLNKSTPTT